jgi:hypothetical protein
MEIEETSCLADGRLPCTEMNVRYTPGIQPPYFFDSLWFLFAGESGH